MKISKKGYDSGLMLLQKAIKNIYFLLPFTLIISGCTVIKKQAPFDLRILTYNIHHGNPPSEKRGVIKLDAIANVIRESKADIVALQELDSATARSGDVYQLQALAQKLQMHYYFGKAIPYDGGAYGVGILSKYKITDASTSFLPKLEHVDNEQRVLALVKIHLPNKKWIWFGSTHFDVSEEQNRLMQANTVLQLSKDKIPIIIGGDFNATTQSASIKKLKTFFTDASVMHSPTFSNIHPQKKIDFIFFANDNSFNLISEKVITEAAYESDHLPYWINLQLK